MQIVPGMNVDLNSQKLITTGVLARSDRRMSVAGDTGGKDESDSQRDKHDRLESTEYRRPICLITSGFMGISRESSC